MAKRRSIWRRVRLVYRPGSPALKWLLVAMVVVCTVVIIVLGVANNQAKKEKEALRQQAIALEQENAKLAAQIAELGSVQSVLRIAREKLGYEDPDAIIFETVDPTGAQ